MITCANLQQGRKISTAKRKTVLFIRVAFSFKFNAFVCVNNNGKCLRWLLVNDRGRCMRHFAFLSCVSWQDYGEYVVADTVSEMATITVVVVACICVCGRNCNCICPLTAQRIWKICINAPENALHPHHPAACVKRKNYFSISRFK